MLFSNTYGNFNFAVFDTGPVRGLEKIWLIGDEFCEKSFDDYYRKTTPSMESNKTYTFINFEVRDFLSSNYSSHNRSPTGCFLNNLIRALNEHNTLPKLIVMIMDDNLIRDIQEQFSQKVKYLPAWLLHECNKAIEIYKDYLPVKAKNEWVPHLLWMAPSQHKNFTNNHKRAITSEFLVEEVKFYKNMSALHMVKIWEEDNSNLYLTNCHRFTSEGLIKYWLSIDSAIRYWNVAIYPKLGKIKLKSSRRRSFKCTDRFHWHKKPKFLY